MIVFFIFLGMFRAFLKSLGAWLNVRFDIWAPRLIAFDNKIIDDLFQPIINGFQIRSPFKVAAVLLIMAFAGVIGWAIWLVYTQYVKPMSMYTVMFSMGVCHLITFGNFFVLGVVSLTAKDMRRHQPNLVRMFGFVYRIPVLFGALLLFGIIQLSEHSFGLTCVDAIFWLWWIALNLCGCDRPGPPLRIFRRQDAIS